jgi:hypothetical protein
VRLPDEKIVLTFDYELFLGRNSGSVDCCLIRPTREILQRIKAQSATALFFVDATYLRLIETNDRQAYVKVAGQIEEMIEAGCEVGLHLHPHWLDAVKRQGGSWSLDNIDRYRLHTLGAEELQRVFCESLASLKRAAGGYTINTFRAGGWCLQPFAPLRNLFNNNGIVYDFSVTPGLYKNSLPGHFYDYRSAPKNRTTWRFSEDSCMPDQNGEFLEVPVTAYKAPRASLVVNNFRIRGQSIFGDGQGVSKGRLRERFGKLVAAESTRQLTLDLTSRQLLLQSLRRTGGRSLRVFASHPKIFSAVSLENLDWLLQSYSTVGSAQIMAYLNDTAVADFK